MEIYIGTIFLIFILAFLELGSKLTKNQVRIFSAFLFVLIIIQIGLRWETGTDWNPYYNKFIEVDDFNTVLLNAVTGFEIGYGLFSFFIHNIFSNYSIFLLIHALFFYSVIFKSLKLFSPYIFITLLFFYATNLGIVGSNRQLLALAICLLSLPFVEKRKTIHFFLLIFVAFLFHTTAFLFSIYYFLNQTFKIKYVLIFLFISIIIGKTSIPLNVFSFGGFLGESASSKVLFYSDGAKEGIESQNLSIFGLIKRLLFLFLFSYNFKILSTKLSYYKIIYNGYLCGLFLYFLFADSLLIIVNRGSLYFNVMESFLISSQFLILSSRLEKSFMLLVLLLISILLLFQSINAYPDLFIPYKSIFYNLDFKRDVY